MTDLETRRLVALTTAIRALPGVTPAVPTLERTGVNTVVALWPDGVTPVPEVATTIAGWDWTAAADTTGLRDGATAALGDTTSQPGMLVRAAALVLVDEINALREWVTAFKAAVAASTTLADLKTRVAALANLPDRTGSQAKTAVAGKVSGGAAD